uniref:Uncharacterized protein n=1 Tax=Thermosporothrix sp. COM3 TaxID=2490863 RepID=A0A455SDG0_9CHLR|nr:hypothetical protein KTC_12280 [Thermosporothrix sp. COM3]
MSICIVEAESLLRSFIFSYFKYFAEIQDFRDSIYQQALEAM